MDERAAVPRSQGLTRATRALASELPALVDECAQLCADGVPALAEPDLRPALVASCQSNISNMLRMLEHEQQVDAAEVPADALALARELVHLGAELSAIQQAYRLGHSWFQKRVIAAVAAEVSDVGELHALTVRVNDWCFAWFDTMRDILASAHEAEQALWRPSGAALRAATIGSLLDGTCDNVDAASVTLGYDLRGQHVALIAWHDAPAEAVDLPAILSRALPVATGARPLVHESSSSALWLWLPASRMPALPEVIAPLHLAVGEARAGAEGFRRSHEDAQSARRVTLLRGGPGPTITAFADVELVALASGALDQTHAFLLDELGPLAAAGASTERLRQTVLAVFEEDSLAAAAARLGVHVNTVVYRVRKAERLLGRGIEEHRLRLQMALHVADRLGLFCDRGKEGP